MLLLLQVPLMDIAGRRLLLIIPMIVMVVDLVCMTISLALQVIFNNSVIRHLWPRPHDIWPRPRPRPYSSMASLTSLARPWSQPRPVLLMLNWLFDAHCGHVGNYRASCARPG